MIPQVSLKWKMDLGCLFTKQSFQWYYSRMGLLNYNGIVKQLMGIAALINEISFTVEKGERVALIGPNGSGKTTSFALQWGLRPVTSVRPLLHGERRSVTLCRTFEASEPDETALYWSEVVKLEKDA